MSVSRATAMRTGLLLGAGLLAACGQANVGVSDQMKEQCVEIPDGYYLFAEGKFSPTSSALALEEPAEVTQVQIAWSHHLIEELAAAGFDWIDISVAGPIATLTGTAPDLETRQTGVIAAKAAIRSDAQGALLITRIVDGTSTDGEGRPPGEFVATLGETPTPEACQVAFERVMSGRNIEFVPDDQSVSPESTPLLDALTAMAAICHDYRLEVAAHTDARGAESYNQRLSQERADAIRQAMIENGVSADRITAVGYGETRPLDSAQTTEAYARNRRVEFNILPN